MANASSMYFGNIIIKLSSKIGGVAVVNKTPSLTVEYNDIIYSATLVANNTDSSIGKYGYSISNFPENKYAVNVKCHLACDGFSPLTFQCKTRNGSGFDEITLYPLTIEGQIARLQDIKTDIRTSIVDKGVNVSDSANMDTFADAIDNIFPDTFNEYSHTYTAVADTEGLKAIGWTDNDIQYFKYNNVHSKSKDIGSTYTVSEVNKAIKITAKGDIATYKDNADFKFCPKFDISNETKIGSTFYSCANLISIPLLDTAKAVDANLMFYNCKSLITIPLIDTSSVTNMSSMFNTCSSLLSIPKLNTSKVTKTSLCFYKCQALTFIPAIDTSSVTDAGSMFNTCESLITVPQLDFSSLTNANLMFYRCSALTTLGGFLGLKADLDLSSSTKLTHDSLMNVINKAADVTSSPKTLTLGSTNLAKLTTDEKAIATNKGWTLK